MSEANYRLKIGRAIEHAEAANRVIARWSHSDPPTITINHGPDGHEHYLIARISKPPDLDRLALLFGDCVHNLRSALDHLVYSIAAIQCRTNPPPGEKILQFPIVDTPTDFSKQMWRIKSLSSTVRAEIERVQPYNRPHRSLPPLLALLRDFDDSDKHRLLTFAAIHLASGHADIEAPARSRIEPVPVPPPDCIVDGAKLATFTVDPPCLDVKYKGKVSLAVGVRHARGPNGLEATGIGLLFSELSAEVETVIEKIERHI